MKQIQVNKQTPGRCSRQGTNSTRQLKFRLSILGRGCKLWSVTGYTTFKYRLVWEMEEKHTFFRNADIPVWHKDWTSIHITNKNRYKSHCVYMYTYTYIFIKRYGCHFPTGLTSSSCSHGFWDDPTTLGPRIPVLGVLLGKGVELHPTKHVKTFCCWEFAENYPTPKLPRFIVLLHTSHQCKELELCSIMIPGIEVAWIGAPWIAIIPNW